MIRLLAALAITLLLATPGFGQPVTVGETTIGSGTAGGLGCVLSLMPVTLTSAGTLESLSIYATAASGSVLLGLYADAAGLPGARLAQTAAAPVTMGWNTRPLATPLPLVAGSYWLASTFDSNGAGVAIVPTGTRRTACSFTLPATAPTTTATTGHVSMYGTLSGGTPVALKTAKVSYTEPSSNWDGTPLLDLARTTIWCAIGTQPEQKCSDVTASTAKGGASITYDQAFTNMPSGTRVTFRVTADDIAGNRSDPTAPIVWTAPAGTVPGQAGVAATVITE